MTLQQMQCGLISLRTLGGTEIETSGHVEEVVGRQLLVRTTHPIAVGATVRLDWNNNVVLGEVQGTHVREGQDFYVVRVEQFVAGGVRARAAEAQAPARSESAAEIFLRAVRESMLVRTPAVAAYEAKLTQLEKSVGSRSDADIASAAGDLLAEYHKAAVADVRTRISAVNATLHILSALLSDISDARVQEVQSSMGDLQQTIAELGIG